MYNKKSLMLNPYILEKISAGTCKADTENKKYFGLVDPVLSDEDIRNSTKAYLVELGYTVKYVITPTYKKIEVSW